MNGFIKFIFGLTLFSAAFSILHNAVQQIKHELYCPAEPYYSVYLLDDNDELFLCKQKTIGYPLELWCEKSFSSFFNIECKDAYLREKEIALILKSPKAITQNTPTFGTTQNTVELEKNVQKGGNNEMEPSQKSIDYFPDRYFIVTIVFAFLLGAFSTASFAMMYFFWKLAPFGQMRQNIERRHAPTNEYGGGTASTDLLERNGDASPQKAENV
uniref:Uncharacterized protein n=1 Tax=Panagrolaimus sp. ES5 TaxID=591445 RepID=A0AC34G3S8_9BILA